MTLVYIFNKKIFWQEKPVLVEKRKKMKNQKSEVSLMKQISLCKMFGAALLVVGLIFMGFSGKGEAADRYLAHKYQFDATGALLTPLTADFGSYAKTAHVETKHLSSDRKLLLVAYYVKDKIFALQMFNSREYSIYKAKLRDDSREEIVILGLGKEDGRRVQLNEICIIGENKDGVLEALPIKGFVSETVLNSHMQLDNTRSILMPLGVSGKNIKIYWDSAAGNFIFNNNYAGAPDNTSAVKTDKEGA